MGNSKKYEIELNFKNIIKHPIRLFGWFYIYFLIIIIASGIFYIKKMDLMSNNTLPETKITEAVINLKEKKGGLKPAFNLKLIKSPTTELINKGKNVYSKICSSCHGKNGMGEGLAGKSLNPAPRNFHSKENWVNGRKFSDMFKTITEGIKNSGMTSYDYLSVEERVGVIFYIRKTFGEFPEIKKDEIIALDAKYKLSKQFKIPNTLPVEKAIKLIFKENKQLIKYAEEYYSITKQNNNVGAQLISSITSKPVKLIFASLKLNGFKNWEQVRNIAYFQQEDFGFNTEYLLFKNKDWKILFNYLNNSKKILENNNIKGNN